MSDDLFPYEPEEKPDWKRGPEKGAWLVTTQAGDNGKITVEDLAQWRAEVTIRGQTTSRVHKTFDAAIKWANKRLFPRLTAWDRILGVK